MFRSGIDLRGKTHILKAGLLASLALLRCQRSLNSLVKCTTSRLLVNCLWTHQKSTCLHINEVLCTWQGSSSHTYLSPWELHRFSWKPQNKGASHSRAGISSRLLFGANSPDHVGYRVCATVKVWNKAELETMIRKTKAHRENIWHMLQHSLRFSTLGWLLNISYVSGFFLVQNQAEVVPQSFKTIYACVQGFFWPLHNPVIVVLNWLFRIYIQ